MATGLLLLVQMIVALGMFLLLVVGIILCGIVWVAGKAPRTRPHKKDKD